MKFCRRREFLQLAAFTAALPVAPHVAKAQDYPNRPVRIIVGFGAGGVTDIVARLIGQWLSERLGQQFFVENRTGAGTNIATEAVVRAPADGYTLLQATSSNAINASLYENLTFNFLRDIAPVAGIGRTPCVMQVNPTLPVKSVPEFIAYAKANPGKLNFGSGGIGTSLHVAGELFKVMTGVDMIHVPYRGEASAMTDLVGGQLQFMFGTPTGSIEHIKAGRLRPLAVTTAVRLDVLPGIPTVAEFVPGYEASGWQGIAAPRNTPPEILNKLNKEINAALADSKFKTRLDNLGVLVFDTSSVEFGKHITEETEKWGRVVKFAGLKSE